LSFAANSWATAACGRWRAGTQLNWLPLFGPLGCPG
jgi:hypothetical protein